MSPPRGLRSATSLRRWLQRALLSTLVSRLSTLVSRPPGAGLIVLDCFEGEAFEVFRLRNGRKDRVIRRLGVGGDAAEEAAGVVGRRKDDVLKEVGINVV